MVGGDGFIFHSPMDVNRAVTPYDMVKIGFRPLVSINDPAKPESASHTKIKAKTVNPKGRFFPIKYFLQSNAPRHLTAAGTIKLDNYCKMTISYLFALNPTI